jgi:2-dehydro-3-deoxygluconokinase
MIRRFVSIGECMVEMSPAATPGDYRMGFAGDTFNTAWYARRLLSPDWAVDYATSVGTDSASERMLAFISGARIGTGHVQRHPERTVGLYLIELQGAERRFSYWRGQSAARTLADDAGRLADALKGAELVYFSGITLAILDPAGRAALLRAVGDARAAGATIAFDPNLRPRLWPDTATMCGGIMQAAATADIVLPSFDDEAAHFGDASPRATADRYAGQGAGLVVVKNGPGAVMTRAGGRIDTHDPVRVAVPVDTTAAGDSFNAGFLAARVGAGAPLADCVASANRLAARVICGRGALVPVD